MQIPTFATWCLISLAAVQAHPGHDIQEEIRAHARGLANGPRDISHCAAELKARGIEQRTVERRAEMLRSEREKRGLPTDPVQIKARDLLDGPTVLATNHLSPIPYNTQTDLNTVFASNKSCILTPEVTEGPYYVSGELIRSDLREAGPQSGVELILDIQVLDVKTCKPLDNALVDVWHANATGVYSGIVNPGNGNGDPSNKETTFGRGLQFVNSDGVVQFQTFYPGHYAGRSHHIHVATHLSGTIWANNNTFQGSTVQHNGQIFFDQKLSASIEQEDMYQANKQPLTTNAQDGIFMLSAIGADPVVEYSHLGPAVNDGIFAWITLGVNTSRFEEIYVAGIHHRNDAS